VSKIFNITLTPGKSLLEALRTDFISQIDGIFQPLVSIVESPVTYFQNQTQVNIVLNRYISGGSLVIPTGLTILSSLLPYFETSGFIPF